MEIRVKRNILVIVTLMVVGIVSATHTSNYCHKQLSQDGYSIYVTAEQVSIGNYRLTVESPFNISRFTEGVYCYTDSLHEGTGTQVNTLNPLLSTDAHTLTVNIPASADPLFFSPLYVQFGMREVNFGDISDIVWGACNGYQEDTVPVYVDKIGGVETDIAEAYCQKELTKGPYSVKVTGKKLGQDQYQLIFESPFKMERVSANSYLRINGEECVQFESLQPVRSTDWLTYTLSFSSTSTPCFYTPLCIEMPDEVNFGYIANIDWTSCDQESELQELSSGAISVKFMWNGRLYIRVGSKVYDASGMQSFSYDRQ